MKVIKFYPNHRAKFHFGDSSGKLKEIFSSDQLFSALFNSAVLLYGSEKAEEFLVESLAKSSISSLFYGINFFNENNGQSQDLYFLPRPLAPIEKKEETKDLLSHKKAKKIKYLSVEAFKLLQQSWREEGEYFNYNLLNCAVLGSNFACTKEEIETLGLDQAACENIKLFTTDAKPKVVVSRLNDRSDNFYYQEEREIRYQQIDNFLVRPFMYFFWRGDIEQRLLAVIRLMADEGLGGKRSQGMGTLGEVVIEEWTEKMFSGEGRYYMSISSVYPGLNEVDKLVYYELTERSGYIYSQYGRPLRKKRVRLLKEGSIFSGQISGALIDIRPARFQQHKVYLSGKAFLIPVGGMNDEYGM